MPKSLSGLAGQLALAACRMSEFVRVAEPLPPLAHVYADVEGDSAVIRGRVDTYAHPDQPDRYVFLDAEARIDALRQWAAALGSDLHLGDAHALPSGRLTRQLETCVELGNGLMVEIKTDFYYDPPADPDASPAPETAVVGAAP